MLLLKHNIICCIYYEKFEEGVIKSQTVKWQNENGQTMIYKTLHRKLTTEQSEPTKNGVN